MIIYIRNRWKLAAAGLLVCVALSSISTPASAGLGSGGGSSSSQSITFPQPADQPYVVGGTGTVATVGTASSGLPVSYSSQTPSVCSIAGGVTTMLTTGTCTITASQSGGTTGGTTYAAAGDVTVSFQINPIPQAALTEVASPAAILVGATSTLSTTGGSGTGAVTYAVTSGFCTVSGNILTGTGSGPCVVTATKAGDGTYMSTTATTTVTVQASQAIAFAKPANQVFANGLTVPLSAVGGASGLPVTFLSTTPSVCTVSGSTVTVVGNGTCSITASQAGNRNYTAAANVTQTFTVSPSASGAALSMNLSASPTTVAIGQPTSLVATVATAGNASPDGTVTFTENGQTLCANVPVINGIATCAATFSAVTAHPVVATFMGNGAAAAAAVASNTVVVNVLDQVDKTTRTIAKFMANRNNQLLTNEPDTQRQIGRLQEAAGLGSGHNSGSIAPAPSSQGNPNDNVPTIGSFSDSRSNRVDNDKRTSFSASLRDAKRRSDEAALAKHSDGITNPSSLAARYNPFDIWVEGKFSALQDSSSLNEARARFGVLWLGADYVVNPSVLIGAVLQLDSMRERSTSQSTEVQGTGWMIGPYATVRLSDHVFLQGRAAWGRSDNQVSPLMTYTDTFSTERWLVSSSLMGRYAFGQWSFKPTASIAYIEDKSTSYTDTYGATIPSVQSRLGQAKIGPEIGYRYNFGNGLVLEPHIGAQLIWNFAKSTTAAGIANLDGVGSGLGGARGRVELGLRTSAPKGANADVSVAYDGIGASNYAAWTGKLNVRVPLN